MYWLGMYQDTIVGVPAGAVDRAYGVPAYSVVIGNDRNISVRAPIDLHSQPRTPIGRAIRLPSVDQPRFNLQLFRGEDLYAHAIEKPWSIGGNVGRLISPVVEVVETEKPNVRQEDAGINVDAMQLVDMISGVCLGEITIGGVEIKLPP